MANRPKNMSDEAWENHVAAAKREQQERARVDADHTACILELERKVAQLEHVLEHVVVAAAPAPAKPASKKKARR